MTRKDNDIGGSLPSEVRSGAFDAWDFLLGGGAILGWLVTILGVAYLLTYMAGRSNGPDPWIWGALCLLASAVLSLIFVARTIWLCWRSPVLITVLRLGLVILSVVSFFALSKFVISQKPYLRGLSHRVIEQADFDAVRAWAASHPGFIGEATVDGLDASWHVTVSDNGKRIVCNWGHGFDMRRALWVLPADVKMPSMDCIFVAPGVYLEEYGE